MKQLKVIVAGSRDLTGSHNFINWNLDYLLQQYEPQDVLIISGGARGVDKCGEVYAKRNDIKCKVFPADWNKHGKRAGYIRNEQMADNANALIAFWDGHSRGTKHMIDIAKSKDINTKVIISPSVNM